MPEHRVEDAESTQLSQPLHTNSTDSYPQRTHATSVEQEPNDETTRSSNRALSLGIMVLCAGILGNLVAAWVQQDILKNSFTWPRVTMIILLAVITSIASIQLDHKSKKTSLTKSGMSLARLQLFWTTIKTRGSGFSIRDVFSIGSKIDINSGNDNSTSD